VLKAVEQELTGGGNSTPSSGTGGGSGLGGGMGGGMGGLGGGMGGMGGGMGGMGGGMGGLGGGMGGGMGGLGGGMGGMGGMGGLGGNNGGNGIGGMAGMQAPTGGTNLNQDAQQLQGGDTQQAMGQWNSKDTAGFDAFNAALQKGDGNTACHDLADAVKSGKLTQAQGAAIGSQLQQTANQNGGGKISNEAGDALKDALGGNNVLSSGHDRSIKQVFAQTFGNKSNQY
jgi:hypothetical protein